MVVWLRLPLPLLQLTSVNLFINVFEKRDLRLAASLLTVVLLTVGA